MSTSQKQSRDTQLHIVSICIHISNFVLLIFLVLDRIGSTGQQHPDDWNELKKLREIYRESAKLNEILHYKLHLVTDKKRSVVEHQDFILTTDIQEPSILQEDNFETSLRQHESVFTTKSVNDIDTDLKIQVDEVDIDDPASMQCMFQSQVCTEDGVQLHSQKGGSYHLISTKYPIILEDGDHSCSLCVVITTMPYSGAVLQAQAVKQFIQVHKNLNFAGSYLWNWHAHSKSKQAQLWLEKFHSWKSTLTKNDFVIFYAPYYDDFGATTFCRSSVVVGGYRSLTDLALLRNKLHPDSSTQSILQYTRSVKHHYDKWKKMVHLVTRYERFVSHENGVREFITELCMTLHNTTDASWFKFNCTLAHDISIDINQSNQYPGTRMFQNPGGLSISEENEEGENMNAIRLTVEKTFHTWLKAMDYDK